MTNQTSPTETTALFADKGFTFTDGPSEAAAEPNLPAEVEEDDDDLEFQPIQRKRMHWLTVVLIGLIIWGGGFLVGVIVDRALAG